MSFCQIERDRARDREMWRGRKTEKERERERSGLDGMFWKTCMWPCVGRAGCVCVCVCVCVSVCEGGL